MAPPPPPTHFNATLTARLASGRGGVGGGMGPDPDQNHPRTKGSVCALDETIVTTRLRPPVPSPPDLRAHSPWHPCPRPGAARGRWVLANHHAHARSHRRRGRVEGGDDRARIPAAARADSDSNRGAGRRRHRARDARRAHLLHLCGPRGRRRLFPLHGHCLGPHRPGPPPPRPHPAALATRPQPPRHTPFRLDPSQTPPPGGRRIRVASPPATPFLRPCIRPPPAVAFQGRAAEGGEGGRQYGRRLASSLLQRFWRAGRTRIAGEDAWPCGRAQRTAREGIAIARSAGRLGPGGASRVGSRRPRPRPSAQVQGTDEEYQNHLRGVVDYLKIRGVSAEVKRRVTPSPSLPPGTQTRVPCKICSGAAAAASSSLVLAGGASAEWCVHVPRPPPPAALAWSGGNLRPIPGPPRIRWALTGSRTRAAGEAVLQCRLEAVAGPLQGAAGAWECVPRPARAPHRFLPPPLRRSPSRTPACPPTRPLTPPSLPPSESLLRSLPSESSEQAPTVPSAVGRYIHWHSDPHTAF